MTRAKWLFAICCAAGTLAGAPQGARAQFQLPQFQLPFSLPWSTGTVPPPQQAAPPPGSSEWSGQPGSSGHPLMTREAILTAAQNFPSCIEGLWPEAAKRGVTRATFDTYTRGLTPDLRIMDLMDTQPEFTKAFWDYLDLLVSDNRIKRGREILAQYRPAFDAMEKAYGVDRHIVTAIWGIESNFGTSGGERSVVRSTATLSCVGRRQAYFRDEFLAALEILNHGDIDPGKLKGSWAGAFGPTQFMPTSFKRYAVDFDGDGRRDVVELGAGPHRLDGEQPQARRLEARRDLGLRGRGAAGLRLPPRRRRQGDAGQGLGKARRDAHQR